MGWNGDLGRRGEAEVGRYLQDRGHVILERNWRFSHLEIDIITLAPDGIHFVEVKTRREELGYPPYDAVDEKKRRRITRAAGRYLTQHQGEGYGGLEAWMDVAAVVFSGSAAKIEYFPAAFVPIFT